MLGPKDPENRSSNKKCCCGSHNSSNVKSNIHHNSTLKRLQYRIRKFFIRKMKTEIYELY